MVHCLHTMLTVNICMKKFCWEKNRIDRLASLNTEKSFFMLAFIGVGSYYSRILRLGTLLCL